MKQRLCAYKYPTSPAPASFEKTFPFATPLPYPSSLASLRRSTTTRCYCTYFRSATVAVAPGGGGTETLAPAVMSLQEAADPPPSATDERPGGLPRSGSASRLNAQAPEFVPRAAAAVPPPPPPQTVVRLFAPPPPPAAFFVAAPPPPPPPFEYYAAVAAGGGARFGPPPAEQEPEAEQPPRDGSFDDPVPKIRKQVGGCGCSSPS